MEDIIDPDQTCGTPGRKLIHSLNILNDIWDITNDPIEARGSLILLSIDQEKAFDKLEYAHIQQSLKTLKFGSSFRKWIDILYKDIKSQLCINGLLTEIFQITRSVRQGCPISMQLFTIGLESYIELIRQNNKIHGYKLPNGKEKKLIAYADDITFIISDEKSISEIFSTFEIYSRSSGATINKDKTEAIRMGKWKKINIKEILGWEKQEIKILGQTFAKKNMETKNYEQYLTYFVDQLKNWEKRDHMMEGHVNLLNIYVYPKLYHKAQNVIIPKTFQTQIEKLSCQFIWGNRRETIARRKIYMPKHLGGLGLHNIGLRQKAIFKKKLVDIIEYPEDDHNILLLSRIGPYPKLYKAMGYKPIISYRQVTNEKIKILRGLLVGKEEIIHQSMKMIYRDMIEAENTIDTTLAEGFKILQAEKVSKLKEVGFKTLHNAHPTRDWLFQRKFLQICENSPLCPTCQEAQTQTHIFESCQTTEPLRNFLEKKLKRNLKYEEIPMDENLRYIILCYQKASIAYRIGENKRTNTTSIQAYFEGKVVNQTP